MFRGFICVENGWCGLGASRWEVRLLFVRVAIGRGSIRERLRVYEALLTRTLFEKMPAEQEPCSDWSDEATRNWR